MRHISFPSIEQFRNVVRQVRDRANYHQVPLPKLKFNGSVKLHGTNAGVVLDPQSGELWCQSREQIITLTADNAGFAKFVEANLVEVKRYLNIIAGVFGNHKIQQGDLIALYGEWCGQGIQKGVAISQVPKAFVVFAAKVMRDDESIWLTPEQLVVAADVFSREASEDVRIFSIQKFKTWEVEIDFAHPELSQNHLIELTNEVEQLCPVGKAFGIEGIGEGIVWRCVTIWNFPGVPDDIDAYVKTGDLIFKVKGEKHSDSKVKKLVTVDVEKVNSINEFVASVITDHRLEKMLEKLTLAGLVLEPQSIPEFLKLVGTDVLKEEVDTLEESNLNRKEVMAAVNKAARQWFLSKVNSTL